MLNAHLYEPLPPAFAAGTVARVEGRLPSWRSDMAHRAASFPIHHRGILR
jgi:hypothetical protein